MPSCIWAKEQLSELMENYLAAASSDKELDKDRCPLSPLLFNLYIQYVINEALEDIQEGVKVAGVLIPAIRFADDQAMVSRSSEVNFTKNYTLLYLFFTFLSHTVRRLQVIMDALQDTSEKYTT